MTPTRLGDSSLTDAQLRQLHILRARGWRIRIHARDTAHHRLNVTGYQPNNDPFEGHIAADGVLYGTPTDPARAPECFGIGAPTTEHIS